MGPDEPTDLSQPHDLAAERACIGAMLLTPTVIEQVAAQIEATDYYKPGHGFIHAAITTAYAAGRPTDAISIAHDLATQGLLSKIADSGAAYLHDCMAEVPVAASASHYAQIVAGYSQRRRLEEIGTRIRQLAAEGRIGRALATAAADLQSVLQHSTVTATNPLLRSLDWKVLDETNFSATEFLTRPLLSPGGQIAIIGDGKVGKSLFCFEWAWRLALGQPFLGWEPKRPYRVLYIDQENSHPELQRRLRTTGFRGMDGTNLTYVSFANIGALDTPAGGADLMNLVGWSNPDVVMLDTVSRMIEGEENSADTWLQLYRLSLRPLKDRGVACVRLDHFGKDRSRGSRGSSAKSQDVDHVWEMTDQPGAGLILRRTHTRNGIGESILWLRRTGDPTEPGTTTHEVVSNDPGIQEKFIIRDRWNKMLTEGGVPYSASRTIVAKFLRDRGEKVRTEDAGELVQWRKDHDPLRQEDLDFGGPGDGE